MTKAESAYWSRSLELLSILGKINTTSTSCCFPTNVQVSVFSFPPVNVTLVHNAENQTGRVGVWLTLLLSLGSYFWKSKRLFCPCVCLAPVHSCRTESPCSPCASPSRFLCAKSYCSARKLGGITTAIPLLVHMFFLKISN